MPLPKFMLVYAKSIITFQSKKDKELRERRSSFEDLHLDFIRGSERS